MNADEIEDFTNKLKIVISDIDNVRNIISNVPKANQQKSLYFGVGSYGQYKYDRGFKDALKKIDDIIRVIIKNRGFEFLKDTKAPSVEGDPSAESITHLVNFAIDSAEPVKGSMVCPPHLVPSINNLLTFATKYCQSHSDEDLLNLSQVSIEYCKIQRAGHTMMCHIPAPEDNID